MTDLSTVIESLAWTKPREVPTKRGPRLVRNAAPTAAFWDLWHAEAAALRDAGYGVGKNKKTGTWEVVHWGEIEAAEVERRQAAVAESRATTGTTDVAAPEGLAYLPYQAAGIQYAMSRPACLIGDEMGLGKTIQAIGVINATPDARHILVICPASLKINWQRELKRWLLPEHARTPIYIVNGSTAWPTCLDERGIVIINYDILLKHIDRLRETAWDILIADEAHFLKTRDARRTRMVFGFDPTAKQRLKGLQPQPPLKATRRVLLTGTPIANRPAELFPLINFLDPVTWSNFFGYAKRYCAAHQNRYGWDFSGASNLPELQERLRRSIMVRRLKVEVLTELPAKRRQVIELPAGDAAGAVSREVEAWDTREARITALQAAVELSKASDNPEDHRRAVEALKAGISAAFSEMSQLRHDTAVAKIPAVIDFVEDALEASGKIILFAHHKDVVRAVAAHFGNQCVTLVGDTSMVDRQAAVDRFQTDNPCKLFIGSTLAAGVGITLTAASHVVFAELDWVPGNVSQAEDRCHRIGQRNSVLVQHLVLEGSLDATMARRIVAKQDVIDRALDTKAEPVYATETEAPSRGKVQPATVDTKPSQIAELAARLTTEQMTAAHSAVQMLSAMCDGARDLDGMGFSRLDTQIGHSLAAQVSLSRKQAALAARLARKYRGQLPSTINETITTIEWRA